MGIAAAGEAMVIAKKIPGNKTLITIRFMFDAPPFCPQGLKTLKPDLDLRGLSLPQLREGCRFTFSSWETASNPTEEFRRAIAEPDSRYFQ
jgi:hypothetical protein